MPDQPTTPKRPKRAGDKRGTPKGRGTVEHQGGRIGNPPFVATEEQRAKVRNYAKVFPAHAQHHIATLLEISEDTLQRHFAAELKMGRAEMLAGVGAQMIQRAMDADAVGPDQKPVAKGDLDAQKFILARLGGWSTKVELTGKGGGPVEHVDLSNLSAEQLEEYGRLAAIAAGMDPETVIGSAAD